MNAARPPRDGRVLVYVRDIPARCVHWITVVCFFVLVATGLYIAHPYLSVPTQGEPFVMGTVRMIHFYTAIVFDVAFGTRMALLLFGSRYERWDQFVPITRARWRSLVEATQFLFLLRRTPPAGVAHDALDGLIFGLRWAIDVVIICSGFAMWADITSYGSPLAYLAFLVPIFGGLANARLIHHVMMWIAIAFVVQHIVRVFTLAAIKRDGTLDSMVSGRKLVDADDLVAAGEIPR